MTTNQTAIEFAKEMRRVGVSADQASRAFKKMAMAMPPLTRIVRDLHFSFWVDRQPVWQRPFMRLAYRIERWVLR